MGEPVGRDVADMVVHDVVIVENKAGRRLDPNAPEQLMSSQLKHRSRKNSVSDRAAPVRP